MVTDKTHLLSVTAQALDMAAWMRRHVLYDTNAPAIVYKSDIEGLDETVLNHLLASGLLCRIALVYGEHISADWLSAFKLLQKGTTCKTQVVPLDDESGDDTLPLPPAL